MDDGDRSLPSRPPFTLQFELQLADALKAAGQTEVPEFLQSSYLVPLEYTILRALGCPGCGATELERDGQASLGHRDDAHWKTWPFSPAGDRLYCHCPACGFAVTLVFWFVTGDLESLNPGPAPQT